MSETPIEVLIPVPVPVLNDDLIVEVDRLRAELAALKAGREVPTSITRCMVRLDGVWITLDTALDEIKRLRAENAALKAQSDPLDAMWVALESYQERSDRHGHGESWRRMCSERTGECAWEAMREARTAARYAAAAAAQAAARALADATAGAVEAMDAIREAKEAKR